MLKQIIYVINFYYNTTHTSCFEHNKMTWFNCLINLVNKHPNNQDEVSCPGDACINASTVSVFCFYLIFLFKFIFYSCIGND